MCKCVCGRRRETGMREKHTARAHLWQYRARIKKSTKSLRGSMWSLLLRPTVNASLPWAARSNAILVASTFRITGKFVCNQLMQEVNDTTSGEFRPAVPRQLASKPEESSNISMNCCSRAAKARGSDKEDAADGRDGRSVGGGRSLSAR